MTDIPINTFQDILDVLEQNPKLRDAMRNHLLGEELLQLPARFAQFVELTQEHNRMVEQRLARLEEEVAALRAGQQRLEERQQRLEERQQRLEERQQKLEERQERLEEGQKRLEERQERLEAGQQRLEEGQTQLWKEVARIRSELGRIGGTVSRLAGTDYEGRAVRRVQRAVRRNMGITGARLIATPDARYNQQLTDLLAQGTELGRITDAQADDLERTDIVLAGEEPQLGEVYVVAEVSLTVEEDDVTRVRRRASVLGQATGRPSFAAVIGGTITDEAETAAMADEVSFLTLEPDEPDGRRNQGSQET